MDFFINTISDGNNNKQGANLTTTAHIIGKMIESSTWEIFSRYRTELLTEEITYIVPAVWGADKLTNLTPLQNQMHDQIKPMLQDIFKKLEINETEDPHSFAVSYVVRYLMVTKIIYMIESFRNKFHAHELNEKSKIDLLKGLVPCGNA